MIYPIKHLPQVIPVGIQTESGVGEICFDVKPWVDAFGDLTLSVWLTRPGDSAAYPAKNVKLDGNILCWTPNEVDTAISGMGRVEILGFAEGKRKLSGYCDTIIQGTSLSATQDPPDGFRYWVDKVVEAGEHAMEAVDKMPSISEEGTWMLWDPVVKAYADSGLPSQGKAGDNGNDGVGIQSVTQTTTSTEDGGENIVTVTKTDGSKSTFAVMNGKKGKDGEDGYTPKKGVDYFDGKDGEDGYTPVKGKDYFDGDPGYTPVKGKDYFDGDPGYTPQKGKDYFDGEDGISPVVEVTPITGGHRVAITDAYGRKTFDVMDGEGSGGSGNDGEDGGYYIPAVVDAILSWTPSKSDMPAVPSADIKGPKGDAGYTPVKGTDYWTAGDRAAIKAEALADLADVQTDGTSAAVAALRTTVSNLDDRTSKLETKTKNVQEDIYSTWLELDDYRTLTLGWCCPGQVSDTDETMSMFVRAMAEEGGYRAFFNDITLGSESGDVYAGKRYTSDNGEELCYERKKLATEEYVQNAMILTSPNGSRFRITVNDNGTLSTNPVT